MDILIYISCLFVAWILFRGLWFFYHTLCGRSTIVIDCYNDIKLPKLPQINTCRQMPKHTRRGGYYIPSRSKIFF